jgi:hypothetical protein
MITISKSTLFAVVWSACICTGVLANESRLSGQTGKPIIDNSVVRVIHVGDIPTIEVDGRAGRYDTVITEHLDFYLILKGRRPDKGRSATGVLYVEGVEQQVLDVLSHETYVVTTPILDLRAWQAVNQRVSPIKLCNDELSYQKGAERGKFLKKGGIIWRHSAYEIKGSAQWSMKKKKSILFNPDSLRIFDSKPFLQGVNVKCLGVNRRLGTKTAETKALPSAAIEKAMNKKYKNQPITATITATPKKFRRAGKFLCPARLQLLGRVNGNREFSGKSFYTAREWQSKKTPLNLNRHSNININASYPLQWTLSGNKPKSKSIEIKMKVVNKNNRVIQTITSKVKAKCKKPDNE